MAQLDPLLKTLIDRGGQELTLVEGQRPTMQFGPDDVRPVSQKPLSREQINALLTELTDQVQAQILAQGEPVRFVYRTPQGSPFVCESGGAAGGLRACLKPHVADPAVATSPPAEPEGVAAVTTPSPAIAAPTPPAAMPTSGGGTETIPAGTGPEIERYLRLIVEHGASDLHLSAGVTPMLRKDGEMEPIPGATPHTHEQTKQLLEAIMPPRNLEQFTSNHDTDFAHEIPGVARFRANIFMDRKGQGAVFRVIPTKILTAEQLNLPQAVLDLCQLTKGLVVVTGPTGSGKSTTLAAMIDYINKSRPDHIITIEDPVEFVHENQKCLVNQREIATHTKGFKPALRAALREDPDIVLVGEMRDLETIAIAIETAETGHLVFGTLHTTTAVSTVDRIIDQFPSDRQAQIRTMLSESIKGVVAQTLLKKIGGGRVAALEVLIVNAAISNLIREGKTFQIPSLMQTGKKLGMMMLNDALLALVKSKTVEPAEAYRKAVDKNGFTSMLRSNKIQANPESAD